MASILSRLKSSRIPNWEEIGKLMRQISSFTEIETPMHNMGVPFPATRLVPIEIENNQIQTFVAQLPFGTPDTIVSHILPMQDYIPFETTEVVSRFPLLLILP